VTARTPSRGWSERWPAERTCWRMTRPTTLEPCAVGAPWCSRPW
jgi:hypothetical protein